MVVPSSRDTVSGEIHTLLGRGTEFNGKLTFDGKVRIDGKFQGEIFSDDTLVLGESAEVTAEISVAVVIVRGGTVRGNIRAKHAVEVYAPGKIYGNITSPQVFIDKGVVFEGQCKMTEVLEE
jgi:cytoskeletal protein CcmA (bactofilin family)